MKRTIGPRFKKRTIFIFVVLLGFIIIQFVGRPHIVAVAATTDLQAPDSVKNIIRRACYDCHSNETQLRWYDRIAPVYWKVAGHVNEGRKALNFSDWGSLAPGDQKAKLWEAVNQIAAGAMPLKDYEFLHSSAKVSAADLKVLKNYLNSTIVDKLADTGKINAAGRQYELWQQMRMAKSISKAQDTLPKDINGIAYIPDYKNWQAVSTTERLDNGTMRVIFGNDVAIKAMKAQHINPWPDGTIFAKVAWDQLSDKDGNVHTGEFKQVEYMIKDAKKYASTNGWGWARFKTTKFLPYGKTRLFTTECINCHRPVANRDFVFTLPIKH